MSVFLYKTCKFIFVLCSQIDLQSIDSYEFFEDSFLSVIFGFYYL